MTSSDLVIFKIYFCTIFMINTILQSRKNNEYGYYKRDHLFVTRVLYYMNIISLYLMILGNLRNIDRFVLSVKLIIHRDNFDRITSFLIFYDAREK